MYYNFNGMLNQCKVQGNSESKFPTVSCKKIYELVIWISALVCFLSDFCQFHLYFFHMNCFLGTNMEAEWKRN